MKIIYFSVGIAVSLFSLFSPSFEFRSPEKMDLREYLSQKKSFAISCTPDFNNPSLIPDDAGAMVPLTGWGNYAWPISTKKDSAQFYFNQGINMYYSFHIIESLASFRKAAWLDQDSPMPYWGIALAYGPNINDVTYTATPKALDAIQKAKELSAGSTGLEKGLIAAMLLRYSPDTTKKRIDLDGAYAKAMKELYQKYPASADAGALYADALMLLHPWDLYDQDQQPKAWTPEITAVLESVLKSTPDHPAANHYYIHAVEASLKPGRALASADKLGTLLPQVSHMVHMPSHIYIRTGMYEKGNMVNQNAIEGYRQYIRIFPSAENGAFLYLFHNQHMQATCAIMNGTYAEALASSKQLRESIPADYLVMAAPEAEYLQYMYMTELFSYIRYGKWDLILNYADLPENQVYGNILLEFGKGIAHARLHKTADARASVKKMDLLMTSNDRLKIRMGAFNTAYSGGEIALATLKGIIAEEENKTEEAIQWLTRAVELEDRMIYDEPRDWLLPSRHFLASVLMKKGQWTEAVSVLKKDLVINPDNGWALTGLWISLNKQGNIKEANVVKKSLEALGSDRNFNKNGPVF